MNDPLARWSAGLAVTGLALLAGCRATVAQPERDWRNSGFLGNTSTYARLAPDDSGFVQLGWTKPGLDLSGYDQIVVDRGEIWLTEKEKQDTDDKEIAEICKYGHDSLVGHIGEEFAVVESAGPRTLRLQWAVTQLVPNTKTGDLFTKVIPQSRTLGQIGYFVTNDQLLSARVQVEARLLDASTGDVLWMGVGARQGGNLITNAWSTWGEAKDAFDTWSEHATEQLADKGMKPKAGE